MLQEKLISFLFRIVESQTEKYTGIHMMIIISSFQKLRNQLRIYQMNEQFNNNSAAPTTSMQTTQQQPLQIQQQHQQTQQQQPPQLQMQAQPSSTSNPGQFNNGNSGDLTPTKRGGINLSRLGSGMNQQANSLLKQFNSPVISGESAQPGSLPRMQQNFQQPSLILPQQAAQANSNNNAFDQNTYMQLLQRQQQSNNSGPMPRPGLVQGPRPQSRGRPGTDMFVGAAVAGQSGQTPDSSLLMSPPSTMTTAQNNNMNFVGGLQHQPPQAASQMHGSSSAPPSMSKMNAAGQALYHHLPHVNEMQPQPQQQAFIYQPGSAGVNPSQPPGGGLCHQMMNNRSTSQLGTAAGAQQQPTGSNFLNQQSTNNNTSQLDSMMHQNNQQQFNSNNGNHPAASLYRNQQQPAQPQQQQQLNFDQFQFIAQLLQNQQQQQQQQQANSNNPQQAYANSQQQPQTPAFTPDQSQQLLQQLLFQAQQQQQQQTQQQTAVAQLQPPTRTTMAQANLNMSQMSNYQQHSQTTYSQQPQNNAAANPQLQQISQNVNQYRRLVEDYKNSNNAVTVSATSMGPQQQQMMLQQTNTSFDNDQRNQQMGEMPPNYESFVAQSQTFALGGLTQSQTVTQSQLSRRRTPSVNAQSSHEQLSTIGNLPPVKIPQMISGRSGDTQISDAITLVGAHAYISNQTANNNMASNSGGGHHDSGDLGSNDMISWPSRGGLVQRERGTSGQSNHNAHGGSGDKLQDKSNGVFENRIIPQFQSEDDNSAIIESKALLGALNGNNNDTSAVVGGGNPAFGSKSLSPIAQNKRQVVDDHLSQDKYSSSFLKSGNDDVVIQDHPTVEQSNKEDGGICWISQQQQPNLQPIKSQSPEQHHHRQDGGRDEKPTAMDDTTNGQKEKAADGLLPKRIFSDSEALQGAAAASNVNQDDVDAQVIHKQDKTFEELLEMNLSKQGGGEGGRDRDRDLPPNERKTAADAQIEVRVADPMFIDQQINNGLQQDFTPVKRDANPHQVVSTTKKAFLRRGSSSKYDPQQARKQSQGSTKKFQYYTDNFSNQKNSKQVLAAPKGTTGIPKLGVPRNATSPKTEDKTIIVSPRKQQEKQTTASTAGAVNKTSKKAEQQTAPNAATTAKKTTQQQSARNQSPMDVTAATLGKEDTGRASQEPKKSQSPRAEPQHPRPESRNNTARLKPPGDQRPPNSSRLKFNPPAKPAAASSSSQKESNAVVDPKQSSGKKNEKTTSGKSVTETGKKDGEKKITQSMQKATSNRLAQPVKPVSTLFRKNASSTTAPQTNTAAAIAKTDVKSVEVSEPQSSSASSTANQVPQIASALKGSMKSEEPKDVAFSGADAASSQTPQIQMESSMCDDREDSFCEKNSIAEFEMLEKECFEDDNQNQNQQKEQEQTQDGDGAAREEAKLEDVIGASATAGEQSNEEKMMEDRTGEEEVEQDEEDEEITVQYPSAKVHSTKQKKQLVSSLDLNKVTKFGAKAKKTTDRASEKGSAAKRKASSIHDSPVRQSAREILNNLKSASTDKQSLGGSQESKLDKLEQQLMTLITEQEHEVVRLKEENVRVEILQSECQKQLERLNKEAQEQDKAKKATGTELKKLKTQLKGKEEEIIRLQENLLNTQEQNQKLQTTNQTLSTKVNQMKSKKREATKEVQTEKLPTRNVMVGTTVQTCDAEAQVTTLTAGRPHDASIATDDGSMTPKKHDESHFTLEENKSVPVSPSEGEHQARQNEGDSCSIVEPIVSNRQIRFTDEESCEVVETDVARGADVLRSARVTNTMMTASSPGDTTNMVKTAKIVTFNLNDSIDQKQQAAATMQSLNHDDEDEEDMIREEELQAEHIDEHPVSTTDNQDAEGDELEEEEEDYDLVFPEQYHSDAAYKALAQIDQVVSQEGKQQKFYQCGKKEIIFPNGVKREVWPDGYQVVFFQNQDIKQTFPGGKIVYFFSQAKTTQTTFPDGLQVFKFQNNQIEKHFPDGTKEISFPDGTIKCLFADGEEESIFPDGTIQKIEKSGLRIIEYSHGQRDYMYPDGTKVREYPNGTVKRYNLDGTVESIQQHEFSLDDAGSHSMSINTNSEMKTQQTAHQRHSIQNPTK